MRLTLRIIGGILGAYLLIVLGMFAAMCQPPERFSQIMGVVASTKLAAPLFLAVPFEPLWTVARNGELEVGDSAPDFQLQTLDKTSSVRLSSFRNERPVVLVFGSYT